MRVYALLLAFSLGIFKAAAQDAALPDSADRGKTLLEHITRKDRYKLSSQMDFQFCTSATAGFTGGTFDGANFKVNRLRMDIRGDFFEDFSYSFRYSYNKFPNKETSDGMISRVELACLRWDAGKRFSLVAGKQMFNLGGYEIYVSGIRVRHFSDYTNTINTYLTGATGIYHIAPDHDLSLQVANNRVEDEAFEYGLPAGVKEGKIPLVATLNWTGSFMDKALQFYYAAAYGQLAEKRGITFLTFGNVWERGPVLAYWDVLYSREELDTRGFISGIPSADAGFEGQTAQNVHYFTTIGNFDYRVHPNWNVYVKGAYETGGVYRANGIYGKGMYRCSWNAQLCAEYFPLKTEELKFYLHLLYNKIHLTERARRLGGISESQQRVSLGLVYTIPVF